MRLSHSITALCAAVLMTAPAVWAAGKNTKSKKSAHAASTSSAPVATHTPTSDMGGTGMSSGMPRFTVSGPITLLDGNVLFGAYGQALWTVIPNLEVGGETGFSIGSAGSVLGVSLGTEWFIPIVATGLYHFQLPDAPTVHPFVGIGLGLAIVNSSSPVVNVLTNSTTSSTSADFDFTAHLGSYFGEERHFFADLRLGVISSAFQFAPTVGWAF